MMSLTLMMSLVASPPAIVEHDRALLDVLSYVDIAVTREALDRVAATPADLEAVARDPRVARYPRMRAASALGHYPDAKTRTALARLVDDGALDRAVRIQAMSSLTFVEGANAVVRLERSLNDPDPELRAAAVRNLTRIDAPRARSVLHTRWMLRLEPVPWVADALARAVDAKR